ncbi:hypothetical protein L7F22_069012 [Adiantum nelumboides]|nr:hypothetical protein [Adiantum nelumboides]
MESNGEVESRSRRTIRKSDKFEALKAAASKADEADADDIEFVAVNDATLDEDAELERKMWEEDSGADDDDEELDEDATMPIEELMKKYGYGGVKSEASEEEEASAEDEADNKLTSSPKIVEIDPEHTPSREGTEEESRDSKWYPGRRDGPREDNSDHCSTRTPGMRQGRLGSSPRRCPHLSHAELGGRVQEVSPRFKILSYYGTQRERKEKRRGWNSENSFNVCITSYQLVLADQHIFRRKPWVYLILDEAHHIKNFRSQRWQTLLGFNSQRRLLLTGTPLQNNLMDLWSLMYFLMPNGLTSEGTGFANMKDFQDWFSNPLDKAVERGEAEMDAETRGMVSKLHTLLRPYLLRRLKSEVEKELPRKYEHVIHCRLSKRQRFLYNDFMSRAKTRESLASGNYLSIINCLMQLRKVCNHPDLFEVRPIVTSFAMDKGVAAEFEIKDLLVRRELLREEEDERVSLDLGLTQREHLSQVSTRSLKKLDAHDQLIQTRGRGAAEEPREVDASTIVSFQKTIDQRRRCEQARKWKHIADVSHKRCRNHQPFFGSDGLDLISRFGNRSHLLPLDIAEKDRRGALNRCDTACRAVLSYQQREEQYADVIDRFAFVTPPAVALDVARLALGANRSQELQQLDDGILHRSAVKLQIAFPDAFLLQYDCGKLQELDVLMRR